MLDRKQEKKISCGQDATIWRRLKITAPILGELRERGPCEAVNTLPVSKHAPELQQTMGKIISRSVSAFFSPHDVLFLSVAKAVDSSFMFLSSRQLLRGVVANERFY